MQPKNNAIHKNTTLGGNGYGKYRAIPNFQSEAIFLAGRREGGVRFFEFESQESISLKFLYKMISLDI